MFYVSGFIIQVVGLSVSCFRLLDFRFLISGFSFQVFVFHSKFADLRCYISGLRFPVFGFHVCSDICPGDFRYVAPIPPFRLPFHLAPSCKRRDEKSVRGMGRHVACACVIHCLCRLSEGFLCPLQGPILVSFDTHVQDLPRPRAPWHAHAACHGMVPRWP